MGRTLRNELRGLIAVAVLAMNPAMAATITFDEFTDSFQGPGFTSGGYSFAGTVDFVGVWTDGPPNGFAFNGTPYLLDGYGSQMSIARADLAAFTLDSFEMALGWYQAVTAASVTVTYTLAAGGESLAVLGLSDAFATYSPGLAITKAVFDLSGAPDGYISMDNINVSAVPSPSSFALMVAGLGVVAQARRRRRGCPSPAAEGEASC